MKKLFFFLVLISSLTLSAQGTGSVQGVITDTNGMPLPGATVYIKSIDKGIDADFDGKFTIENIDEGTYNVLVSFVGFESVTKTVAVQNGKKTQLNISLKEASSVLDEVILTANKKPQKITEVPATVNVISAKDIQDFPSFNIGELAARQKGVDFVRSGVLGTGINIRGFNSAFNSKNLQMTDDRVSMLIATGLPYGSFSTVTKDDVERVEILLGPNGTLYGPNAHNGLVSTITKNPRTSEGTTIAVGVGDQNVVTGRLRHAQVLSDKFAYKIHLESTQGTEFNYVDSVYVGTKAYGEKNLDRDFNALKYGASLYYKPTSSSEITAYYGHSNNTNLAVNSTGRNQIKDWTIDVAQLKYVSKNFFANAYYTWSKTDETYSINQRTKNYIALVDNGFSEEEAWDLALYGGALFRDASERFNAEAQYNNSWGGFYLTTGVQHQLDMADSKGTYLMDLDGSIDVNQTGVYGQFEYKLSSGWNFLAGIRADNHDIYGTNLLPKAAVTKTIGEGTFRLTYGKGIAAPTILNLKGYLFEGLLLGNSEGFTLTDGTKINKLEVETINSFEFGYKGKLSDKLYIDASTYYNMSENFISPALVITDYVNGNYITHIGSEPIDPNAAGASASKPVLISYVNFGSVDTYGVDLGMNYYFTDAIRASINYSYFGRSLDKNDLSNDLNSDGKVLETELPVNTPENKFSLGLHYGGKKLYGSVFGRWVQDYDFFSGSHVAAKTQDLNGDGINDVIENGKGTVGNWNYGPLGGFTVDANLGYNLNDNVSVGMNITNVFDASVREFVASPEIGRLVSFELKYNFNAFKKK